MGHRTPKMSRAANNPMETIPVKPENDQLPALALAPCWACFCCDCSAEITRDRVPPPCHHNRMRCKKCRNEIRLKARANWIAKNPEAERKHRRKVGRRNTEKRRARSRDLAESTGARWSGEEESYLMRNIGKMTQEEIGTALGRSLSSIEVKLWRLRAALPNNRIDGTEK